MIDHVRLLHWIVAYWWHTVDFYRGHFSLLQLTPQFCTCVSAGHQRHVSEHASRSGGAGWHPAAADKEGGEGERTSEERHHSAHACCWKGNADLKKKKKKWTMIAMLTRSSLWIHTTKHAWVDLIGIDSLLYIRSIDDQPYYLVTLWIPSDEHLVSLSETSFLWFFTCAVVLVSWKNFLTTVAILLEAGSCVNAQTLGGETALMKVTVHFPQAVLFAPSEHAQMQAGEGSC